LAQKGGATWSHILIAPTQDAICTTRVGMGAADLVLGCDPIVTLLPETMQRIRAGRSHVALNAHGAPTAAFVSDTEWKNPAAECRDVLIRTLGADDCGVLDADSIATHQLGDSLFTNPVMLGFAWQKGWIPLQQASIFRAMELNAVAVEANKAAFIWGRRAALGLVDAADNPPLQAVPQPLGLEERIAFLTAYQNAKYAAEYADFIQTVRVVDGDGDLTQAVIQNLFHLMAYKDEYEVARLHTDSAFLESLKTQFEGDFTLNYHLAPPLFAKRDNQGRLQKRRYGSWMQTAFRLLAGLRGLRGTVFDMFGYTAERSEERALIHEYRAAIQALLPHFAQSTVLQRDTMLTFARLPMQIRGYGHVKARNLAAVRQQWKRLTDTLRSLWC
jgi:indolepyruvate ferredoxin oxidoreductase